MLEKLEGHSSYVHQGQSIHTYRTLYKEIKQLLWKFVFQSKICSGKEFKVQSYIADTYLSFIYFIIALDKL